MQNNLKLFKSTIIISIIFSNNMQAEKYQKPDLISLGAHYSLIDNPKDASDSAQNIFTDLGAWFGFALPNNDKSNDLIFLIFHILLKLQTNYQNYYYIFCNLVYI